ncbi:hypothetical protein P5673_007720, partial [Acropora cervicornis]
MNKEILHAQQTDFKAFVLFFALFAVATSGAAVCKCAKVKKKDFKALVLFFVLFAAAASGATVCKCAGEKKK